MGPHSFTRHPYVLYIPARRAKQDLEHDIRNELLDVAAHFTDLERLEAWVELYVLGFEPRTSITLREWTYSRKVGASTNWASQTD